MWLRHWGLKREPFAGVNPPYVSLPSHDEAVARLAFAIERADRSIDFFAHAGLGKTTVVRQAIRETRAPRRRWVQVQATSDGGRLLGDLAEGFGLPFLEGSDRDRAWRSLARAIRGIENEGAHLVLIIDGWDEDTDAATIRDLTALLAPRTLAGAPASLIRVGRRPAKDRGELDDSWTLSIGLERLTRSEAAAYLGARLADAGRRERVFTPRALSRLHSWADGVPRGLDQIATLALIAGAVQGLEVVTPDVVDGVASRNFARVHPAATIA